MTARTKPLAGMARIALTALSALMAAGLIAGAGVASADDGVRPDRTSGVDRVDRPERAADDARSAHWYPDCDRGEFCLWTSELFWGDGHRIGLDTANPGECVPLPAGFDARSFVNRTTRPVTVYQGEHCSTEGEFATYPGGGTYVPAAPHLVRGVQIWER